MSRTATNFEFAAAVHFASVKRSAPSRQIPAGTGPTINVPMILVESPDGSQWWYPNAVSLEEADDVIREAVKAGKFTATKVVVPICLPDASAIGQTLNEIQAKPVQVELTETEDDPFAADFAAFVARNPGALA